MLLYRGLSKDRGQKIVAPKTSVRNGFPRILGALDPMPATTLDLRATWLQTS
jgi:hypothetical protein